MVPSGPFEAPGAAVTPGPLPDHLIAATFLSALDDVPTNFNFRVIDDHGSRKGSHAELPARNIRGGSGALKKLSHFNSQGYGVFVVVNVGGHRANEINQVRAVYLDLDGAPLHPVLNCALKPTIITESSPGRWHAYWLVAGFALQQFRSTQLAIADRFNGDRSIQDLSRVMRVPGFVHRKATPFQSTIVHIADSLQPYTAAQVLAEFKPPAAITASTHRKCRPVEAVKLCIGSVVELPDMRVGDGPFAQQAASGSRHNMLIAHAGTRFSEGRTLDEVTREARGWNLENPEPLDDAELTRAVADIHRRHGLQLSKVESTNWGEPEPLVREAPPSEPYRVEALGSVLGAAAAAMHNAIQAPLAVCGQSVLAAASLAAQGHANVKIDGRTYPLSLWAMTIAESGERKSAVDAEALRAHKEYERDQVDSYLAAKRAFAIEQAAFEKACSAAPGKGKDRVEGRDAISKAIAAVGTPPEPPLLPYLTATEPTLEGVHKLLELGRPAIGLFSDEGGQFFGGHAMSRDHATKTAAGLSRLWDGGRIDRVRAGEGASILHGRRLALHLMLQPVIAESVLADPLLAGQGLLARCLLAWPKSTAGHRPYREIDLMQDASMKMYWAAMRRLLVHPMRLRDGSRNELEPRPLTLTAEAKQSWIRSYNQIEAEMSVYAQVRPFASKAAEQALRVAGVLAVVADPDARSIEVENIRNAVSLMAWHLGEAVRLAGTASTSPGVRNAVAVLSWCRQRQKLVVHSAELVRTGPGCVREAAAVHAAMSELVRAGWAMPADGLEVDGRKRRRAWRLHPHISCS